jgi:glycosyltransferase involved in cell wall biosynthesis
MNSPLISVVLCTYNGERFLEEQLNSILNQTYTHFEIIISDDASTDNTLAILGKYRDDKRIKIFQHKNNLGYIENFESTLKHVNGSFIAFSDQDDIWLPNKLECLLNNIGDKLLVYSNSLYIDKNGGSLHKKLSDISLMYSGTNSRGFILWNVVWGHSMLIKKELLSFVLPIPAHAPHDIWMAFKATDCGGIQYVNEVLTHYRQHNTSVTHQTFKSDPNTRSRTLKKRHEEYLKNIEWFTILQKNAQPNEQSFYNTFIKLYKQKEQGFAWQLFFFMIKHRKDFFLFRDKKVLSQIVEIRKLCRHEKI